MPSRLTKLVPAPLRALERIVHNGWMRVSVRLMGGGDRPLPTWSARPYRVLFVRYDRLGDMIMCTGILRAIAEAQPTVSIDVLTTPQNAPALANLPFVHDVILHRRGEWARVPWLLRRLAKPRYDVVIDGLVIRPSVNSYTAFIMAATRARWRIGSTGRTNDFVYNVPVAPPPDRFGEHHIEHLARLTGPFGLDVASSDWRSTLKTTRDERAAAAVRWGDATGDGRKVLVNLSAGHPERRWPDTHFAEALEAVRRMEPDARIVIVALPAERRSAESLAPEVGATVVIPTVRELFALVESADLVISPDTAVTHMASAFRRPTIALMRRREEYAIWVPYRTPGRNVFGDDELSLAGLPAGRVVEAIESLLSEDRDPAMVAGRGSVSARPGNGPGHGPG